MKLEVRGIMDRLLEGGVIRRGLVLNCEDCGQLSFYPLRTCSRITRALDAHLGTRFHFHDGECHSKSLSGITTSTAPSGRC